MAGYQPLEIRNESLRICLENVRESVKRVWEIGNLVKHYTKHDIGHSGNIIRNLEKLLEDSPDLLNENERFVLLAATYLHDIGMQSPTHAGLGKKSQYSIEELEEIRDKHNESSARMIIESVNSQNPLFKLGLDNCREYATFIATLAKYHRKLDLNEIKDTEFAGEDMRLRLLASLLRLGDALDQDFRRVNMNVLKIYDIPLDSKFYWWAHYYVSSIDVKEGKIKVYFRFPEEYKETREAGAFRQYTIQSIRKHLSEVYNILYRYGIRLYHDVEVEGEGYDPTLEKTPDDLLEYIKQNILNSIEGSQELSRRAGVVWFVDGVPYSDNTEVVKCIANIIKLVNDYRNWEAVEEIERGFGLIMAPLERTIFLITAANCYYTIGKLNEAKTYYEEALKISERKDLLHIYKESIISAKASALGNIGLVYARKGELDKALKYFEDALKIHGEIGDRQGEANQLGNIGLVYARKGELDKALKYHEDALKIDREIGDRQGEASDLGNIGLVYARKGELDEALKHFEEALAIMNRFNLVYGRDIIEKNIDLIKRKKSTS